MSLRFSARHGTEESAAHRAIVGIHAEVHGCCVQALRGTAAPHADLAKVQAWLGHAPRATMRLSFMQRLALLLFSPSGDSQLMRAPCDAWCGNNSYCYGESYALLPYW